MCVVRSSRMSSDEHGFAVRIHKPPPGFAKTGVESDGVPCSCWVLFPGRSAAVQDAFESAFGRADSVNVDLPF